MSDPEPQINRIPIIDRELAELQRRFNEISTELLAIRDTITILEAGNQQTITYKTIESTEDHSHDTEATSDHGALGGLDDDDHLQYLLHADNIVKTGWDIGLDETDITIAMTDGSRTFTITPDSTLDYYILGIKYTLSGPDTVVFADTEGLWYIYFVGSTLTASQSRWEIADGDKCMIAIVYWDATNNASITIGWQFHSHFMAAGTHDYAHHSFGTRYASGLAVTDAGSDLLNVAAGVIFDEDIEIDITDGAGSDLFEQVLSPAELPILYRSGAGGDWRKVAATTRPVHLVANVLQLNELNGTWALANVTNNSYIAYWILATNDISEPIISIPGQVEGTNIVNVRENNPLSSMDFSGLPVAEFRVIARLIVKGLVGGIFYEVSAIDDFRAVSNEPGTTQPNIHASSHFANGVDELLLDEDDMVSDLATKGTSQQAAKAYADTKVTSAEAIAAVEGNANTFAPVQIFDEQVTINDQLIIHDDALSFTTAASGQFNIQNHGLRDFKGVVNSGSDYAFRFRNEGAGGQNIIFEDGTVKNPVDNKGFYTGAGDDLRMFHDGNSWIKSIAGALLLYNTAGASTSGFRIGGFFRIQDIFDGNVTLLDFATQGRTLAIGIAADPIDVTQHGDYIMGGTGGDDEKLQVPYLTGAPATLANGMIWMEADGLHIYYNGAEKLVAGV